jgi:hypothetical protein
VIFVVNGNGIIVDGYKKVVVIIAVIVTFGIGTSSGQTLTNSGGSFVKVR